MSRYIPEETISDILSRSDIHDVISSYIPLKKNGNRYKALCPFHNEKTPSFVVSPERQTFHCFGCGKGGNVFSFIMEKENLDFPEAVRLLASRCGVFIPDNYDTGVKIDHKKVAGERESLYSMHRIIAEWYSTKLSQNQPALEYLAGRNITPDIIDKFKIGFAPESWDTTINYLKENDYSIENIINAGLAIEKENSDRVYDRFRNRIMFSIWNDRGDIVAFSARSLEKDPKGGKYINSPETKIFKKSKILYALPLAKDGMKKKDFAILCEGQIDVITMHRIGYDNAVAPQGTAFTEEQAQILKRYTNNIYICFDGDQAGINATFKAIDILLANEFEIRIIQLPENQDPDSIFNESGKEALEQLVENATDFLEFMIYHYTKGKDLSSPFVKNDIAKNILEKISKIQSNILRTSYASLLADRLNIQEKSMLVELKNIYNNSRTHYSPEKENQPVSNLQPAKLHSIITEAEKTLLELAIIDGTIGRRLDEELPVELISNTPIGQSLNTAISITVNDEWENIVDELSKLINKFPNSELSGILTGELSFPESYDREKAVSDCIRNIKLYHNKKAIDALSLKLKSTATAEEKRELFMKITNLQKKQIQIQQS